MDMTLDQYISNPMGKNNAVLSGSVREITRKDYTHRFNNILLRENGKIDYFVYKGKGNEYYFHIKIPSEVVKNFYYDVVLKFTPTADQIRIGTTLNQYKVQFYSNDPAFVYTYAHVFLKNDLFIKELASKMSKRALKEAPNEKNPNKLVGYVKSLFFAYLFMQQRGLFNPIRLTSAQPLDLKYLVSQIEDADTKIEKRQEEGEKVSKKKKVEVSTDTAKKINRIGMTDQSRERLVTTTNKVQKVKRSGSSNSSRKSIKSTNKV